MIAIGYFSKDLDFYLMKTKAKKKPPKKKKMSTESKPASIISIKGFLKT
jgi:hypothetical protein